LRELEYFQGIIFLTTNLYHTIDSAFRSRVSLHLLFKHLAPGARELIWKKFLDKLPEKGPEKGATEGEKGTAGIAEDGMKELGLWKLNGREIKNAVKIAQSWCDYKGYDLNLARLENGIKVTSPHASKEGQLESVLYN
jgi:hypothetical protein